MIIEAVLVFGLMSALFEAVLLLKLPPRLRLRLLGSGAATASIHIFVMLFNLFVHYGTVTGTMSAIVAGITSFLILPIIKAYSGTIRKINTNNKPELRYFPGFKRYSTGELR